MRLEKDEYRIKSIGDLEEWRDHYQRVATDDEYVCKEWQKAFYMGKGDVLTEILKHFEEE